MEPSGVILFKCSARCWADCRRPARIEILALADVLPSTCRTPFSIWLAYVQPENIFCHLVGCGGRAIRLRFWFQPPSCSNMIYIAARTTAPRTRHLHRLHGAGMHLPAAWSGWLQEPTRLQTFFFVGSSWRTIPSFLVAMKIPLEPEFGRKSSDD